MLLTSDWHLDDNPANEYRWRIFDHVRAWIATDEEKEVFHLGDLTDRKDRHSAKLVNRLVEELRSLFALGATVYVLMGNHDKPLKDTPYWSFLNSIAQAGDSYWIKYITNPYALENVLLLPYADNPAEEWQGIDYTLYTIVLMHQTLTGATGNNGIQLTNPNMPALPKGPRYYSGDIHTTQRVGRVVYVGAPHPVAFGDTYPPQMLQINKDSGITEKIISVDTIQKLTMRVHSLAELEEIPVFPGDQVKVVYHLPLSDSDVWLLTQNAIRDVLLSKGALIASIEPNFTEMHTEAGGEHLSNLDPDTDPEHVLDLFATMEQLDARRLEAGLNLLKESQNA